jgi:hypothetical protein
MTSEPTDLLKTKDFTFLNGQNELVFDANQLKTNWFLSAKKAKQTRKKRPKTGILRGIGRKSISIWT